MHAYIYDVIWLSHTHKKNTGKVEIYPMEEKNKAQKAQ